MCSRLVLHQSHHVCVGVWLCEVVCVGVCVGVSDCVCMGLRGWKMHATCNKQTMDNSLKTECTLSQNH
jgi:hypothetical protein